jgi:A/G-specific adenine glycosylase
MPRIADFRKIVWKHYKTHGRDLPWRHTKNPYFILVSEIMLQQTQVTRVSIFYPRFIKKFPTVSSLANASLRAILKEWQGLGYNRRAVSLKRSAEIIIQKFGGKIPHFREELESLPGVGPGTAGAILAYAFDIGTPFIETNIRRVFIHHFFPNKEKISDTEIVPLIEAALPRTNPRDWYYALMDYGTFLAKTVPNPNRRSRSYHQQSQFKGSQREVRGKIVRLLVTHPKIRLADLPKIVERETDEVNDIVAEMLGDGLVSVTRGFLTTAA